MHLIRSHRLVAIWFQIRWLLSGSKPALHSQWKVLCSPNPHLEVQGSLWRLIEYLSLLHICWYHFTLLIIQGDSLSLAFLFWLIESFLVILHISCQVPFHLCLGFPETIPTHPNHIPVLFPGHISLLPLAVHFLIPPQCEEQILDQSCLFLAYLHTGTENSCALRKMTLKSCQFWSAPLSLRTVSQWISFANSLNNWKFALLTGKVGIMVPLSRTKTHKWNKFSCGV